MFAVTTSWHNDRPDTIWNKLAARLGREPTHAEIKSEVQRILLEARIDMAGKGKLPHQRKR